MSEAAAAIMEMLRERGPGKTVCPSEAARRLAGASGEWRAHMGAVHAAVDELVGSGRVALSRKGVAMPRREGPYRIGLPR